MVERQRKYKIHREKILAIRKAKCREKTVDMETDFWTAALHYLNFADGDDFDSLDRCYISYGPDEDGVVCCTMVGPRHGPFRIYGPKALKAFNRLANSAGSGERVQSKETVAGLL